MTRQCAYEPCGREFTPSDARQRYCNPDHSMSARNGRRGYAACAHCKRPLVASEGRRFCEKACQWAYAQERRGKRGKRVIEPVAVLLPIGCQPARVRMDELRGDYGEVVRKIYCRQYKRCLSYAVSKNWGGFGCQECKVEDAEMPEKPMSKRSNWEW